MSKVSRYVALCLTTPTLPSSSRRTPPPPPPPSHPPRERSPETESSPIPLSRSSYPPFPSAASYQSHATQTDSEPSAHTCAHANAPDAAGSKDDRRSRSHTASHRSSPI